MKAVEIDDRLGGAPVQVRVVQGQEPAHFLAIFQGQLIIYQGGHSSSFDENSSEKSGQNSESEGGRTKHLLQIHGRTPLTTYATQVTLSAASLNTNDCFVYVSPEEQVAWVWLGKGSTGDEKEMAKRIALMSDKDPDIILEGQEKPDFWALLGGKKAYMDEFVMRNVGEKSRPRLFHGSNASGTFKSMIIFLQHQLKIIV